MKITFQNSPDATIEQGGARQQVLHRSGQTFQGVNAGKGFSHAYKVGADDRTLDKLISAGEGGGSLGGIDSMAQLQQMAGAVDGKARQDYMTLMSNTLSDEDYEKFLEDGFDPKEMEPGETVTILDKIKAEIAKSGKVVTGYNDDMDTDILREALGSETLALEVSRSFARADLPISEEMAEDLGKAWGMASSLTKPADGVFQYMIREQLPPEIESLYLAESSGAGEGSKSTAMFYSAGVQGYYAQSGSRTEEALADGRFQEQVDQVIRQADLEVGAESRRMADWLLERNLPLTSDNLLRYRQLTEIPFPVTQERFALIAAEAVAKGRSPRFANLTDTKEQESVYERANRLAEQYDQAQMTDRRTLEEIRLHMTAEVNVKLLKSGFSIDTAPMEELVEALRIAQRQVAEQYFPGDSEAVSKYCTYQEVNEAVRELPAMPAKLLGTVSIGGNDLAADDRPSGDSSDGENPTTLSEIYRAGRQMQREMEQARERYETLMTAPRTDLGDSIRKAFANVDDILKDLGYETSEENRKAVRVLGYNRMDLSVENIDRVREAQRTVSSVIEKMTPASVLRMIRDDINPMEKSFAQLESYLDEISLEYQGASESYSRFLYRLEKSGDISPEERESYIGIYRLLHQIEKKDGAAVGMLLNTGADLRFDNLLSAARTGKISSLDIKLTEEEQIYTRLAKDEHAIDSQIDAAYQKADRALFAEAAKVSDRAETLLHMAELSSTVNNLLAAQGLLQDAGSPYEPLRRRRLNQGPEKEGDGSAVSAGSAREADTLQEFSHIWERLDEASFSEQYRENVTELQREVQEETFLSESFLDVRQMQLAAKQLSIVGKLADNGAEEFFLPLEMGGEPGRLHLRLEHAESEKHSVTVELEMAGARSRAEFSLSGDRVAGMIWGHGDDEVMKLSAASDILVTDIQRELGFHVDEPPVIIDAAKVGDGKGAPAKGRSPAVRPASEAAEEPGDRVSARKLLQLAKMWIKAMTQKEVAYEN